MLDPGILSAITSRSSWGNESIASWAGIAGGVMRARDQACIMPRAPFRLFACPLQSILNFILLDHHCQRLWREPSISFFLPLLPVGNHELTIHPRRTPDKFDPSRLGETSRWRCQRFAIRSVILNLIPPTPLCVARMPG